MSTQQWTADKAAGEHLLQSRSKGGGLQPRSCKAAATCVAVNNNNKQQRGDPLSTRGRCLNRLPL